MSRTTGRTAPATSDPPPRDGIARRTASGTCSAPPRLEICDCRRRLEGPHVALLEQGLSDVRASKRATLRDLEHAIEIDRVAEPVQLLDHELDATASVLAEPSQPVLECRVRRINEVPEDVRVSPLGLGVELGRWDDAHP